MRRGSQNRRAFQGDERDDESSASADPRRTSQTSYAELMRVYGGLGSRASPHALAAFGTQGIDTALEQQDSRETSGEGAYPERYGRERSYGGQGSGNNSNADEGSGGDGDIRDEDEDGDHASGDEHDDSLRYGRHAGGSDNDDDDEDEEDDVGDDDDDNDDDEMAGSREENTSDEAEGEDGDGSNNDYDESEVYDVYHDNYEHAFSSGRIGASYEDLPSLIASASRQAETRQLDKQPRHKDSRTRLSFMPRYLENTAYGALYRKNARNGHSRSQGGGLNGVSGRDATATSNVNGMQVPLVSSISPDIFFKTLVQDTWPHYCTPGPAIPTSFAGLQLGGYGLGMPPDQITRAQPTTVERQSSQLRQRGFPEGTSASITRSRFMSGKPEGLRLPSEWAPLRNSHNISIGSDRVTLRYTGPGRQDNDAAMVLTDVCIPTRTGVYYFEVQIKSRGQSGYIGIGLSRAGLSVHRLPGWDIGSWGYHGDDGHVFGGDGRGTGYGPRFTTGDTVGCGVDFVRQRIFFTRNGFFLGYAFGVIDTSQDLFPCIGMRTPGEHVMTNFGRKPFEFDIDNYVETAHDDALKTVGTTPLGPLLSGDVSEISKESGLEQVHIAGLLKARNEKQSTVSEKDQVGWSDAALGMVISYLVHSEHYSTACALIKNAIGLCSADSELAGKNGNEHLVAVLDRISKLDAQRNSRRQICKHICEGEIDYALGLLQESYPRVLEDESLVFQLRCRQFIELVRSASGCHIADCVPNDDSQLSTPESYLHAEEGGNMMDVDDTNSSVVLSLAAVTNAPETSHRRAQFGQIKNLRKMQPAQLVRVMLEYGRQLQADYGSSPNLVVREGLVHTFSLLAYADPAQSPIAALLDPSACKPLARLVEMAISASEGAPRMTSLENISRQTGALLNELSTQRNGAASLISLERDFLAAPGTDDGDSNRAASL
ncbi:hypothetical protein LPJ81_000405 [Coemansia sp. IMI 209127]|nr:hypothetical protein LPJ81_000405 [Coemansia sp. IMI 209127]